MSENHEVALAPKIIIALAFKKIEEIKKSFILIVEEITTVADEQHLDSFVVEKIDLLCLYFQTIFIKCPLFNRLPIFPPQIWNQRDTAFEGTARQNNAVEGWHYGIQASFSGSHPEFGNFFLTCKQTLRCKLKLFECLIRANISKK